MGWYYKDGAQEFGPVSKEELQELIKEKKINGRTPVRSTEMTEWRNLAEMVRPKAPAAQPPPTPAPEPIPEKSTVLDSEASATGSAEDVIAETHPPLTGVCSQCGRAAPMDQMVRYTDQMVCAACKPLLVQRLKEGINASSSLRYAGFWIRFVAKFIDGIIMAVVQWSIFIPMGLMSAGSMTAEEGLSTGFLMLMGVQQLVGILIPAIYNTFFVGRFGATPGKMACRLRIVMPEGESVSYKRALGRNFAEWVSAMILLIGYIMAAFDTEKRALHDRLCNTRVVYK